MYLCMVLDFCAKLELLFLFLHTYIKNTKLMTIHKEGYSLLTITIISLIILNALVRFFLPDTQWLHTFLLVASLIFFFIILQFFRKPARVATINPNQVIAPCDGKVVVIEEVVETE